MIIDSVDNHETVLGGLRLDSNLLLGVVLVGRRGEYVIFAVHGVLHGVVVRLKRAQGLLGRNPKPMATERAEMVVTRFAGIGLVHGKHVWAVLEAKRDHSRTYLEGNDHLNVVACDTGVPLPSAEGDQIHSNGFTLQSNWLTENLQTLN
jgi:hypothetical protein